MKEPWFIKLLCLQIPEAKCIDVPFQLREATFDGPHLISHHFTSPTLLQSLDHFACTFDPFHAFDDMRATTSTEHCFAPPS